MGRLALFLVALALAAMVVVAPAHAAFPGANGKIAFEAIAPDRVQTEIFTINPDGSGRTQLTADAAHSYDPAWSPDGARIVFASQRDGDVNGDIYSMNADGTGVVRLTSELGADTDPNWSPDGTKIVWSAVRWVRQGPIEFELIQVYTMNADGTDERNISNTLDQHETSPVWKPDGTKILFGRDGAVWEMNPDGTGKAPTTLPSTGPWSPDGAHVAYVTCCHDQFGNREIHTTAQAGALARGDSPAWSPDGTKLAYQAVEEIPPAGGGYMLWTMSADGTNRIQLSPLHGTDADWQPLVASPPPAGSANPSHFCKAERQRLGNDAFVARYGTGPHGANAHGQCVKEKQRR